MAGRTCTINWLGIALRKLWWTVKRALHRVVLRRFVAHSCTALFEDTLCQALGCQVWRRLFEAFFYTLFDGCWVPKLPLGGEFASRAVHLWQHGNMFGSLEGDITGRLCTFCTEASAKPLR